MNKRRIRISRENRIYLKSVFSIFVIILISSVALFSAKPKITSFITYSAEDLKTKIENAMASGIFSTLGTEIDACVEVKTEEQTSYFTVDNIGKSFEIVEEQIPCIDQKDIIVHFTSSEGFSGDAVPNIDFNTIRQSHGKDYWFYESKFIRSGGYVICDDEFKAKFCRFIKTNGERNDMEAAGLGCCYEKGAVMEIPGQVGSGLLGMLLFVLMILVMIAIIMFIVMKKSDKDAEIKEYIRSALAKGYDVNSIRQTMMGSGWNANEIDDVLVECLKPNNKK